MYILYCTYVLIKVEKVEKLRANGYFRGSKNVLCTILERSFEERQLIILFLLFCRDSNDFDDLTYFVYVNVCVCVCVRVGVMRNVQKDVIKINSQSKIWTSKFRLFLYLHPVCLI